jgi:PAS domain S-box-containing protein
VVREGAGGTRAQDAPGPRRPDAGGDGEGVDALPGEQGHRPLNVLLPPDPASVAEARQQVRGLVLEGGRPDLVDTAVLVVSELVTNALLHAGTEIGLAASLQDGGLHVEVSDGSPHLPSRRNYGPTSGTGRGLLMLESMADDWGVTPLPQGKIVWFDLATDGTTAVPVAGPDPAPPRRRARRPTVPVRLQNMPLLLHAAWQEHAEALLREYLLVSLDADAGDPIRVHADATDAIAVLEEHVPRAPVPMEPSRIMGDAIEPRVSAAQVEIPVPLDSIPHFETLDRAIEAALDLSDDGLVLTPPTQPEVQSFRRWLTRQVIQQATGGAAEPWSVPEHDEEAPSPPVEWDPSPVDDAESALIAAEHSNRILAVSRSAAELLGYAAPADLVGERIVSIIPERYRQAHVAGFTMYLLVGRRPLLEDQVVVPALRRDGSEVEVALRVRELSVAPGRTILLAELTRTED